MTASCTLHPAMSHCNLPHAATLTAGLADRPQVPLALHLAPHPLQRHPAPAFPSAVAWIANPNPAPPLTSGLPD